MTSQAFDKNYFKAQSFEDADKANLFDHSVSVSERLNMSFDLVCTIFGLSEKDLKIDRSVFSTRKFG